jgi:hypothetical protein
MFLQSTDTSEFCTQNCRVAKWSGEPYLPLRLWPVNSDARLAHFGSIATTALSHVVALPSIMSAPSNHADDTLSPSNLASTSPPSQDGFNGVFTVTPATISQSQSQVNGTTESDIPILGASSPTDLLSPDPLASLRDFTSPEVPSPTRLSSPLFRRTLDGTDVDGLKRHGANLHHTKKKRAKQAEKTVNLNKSLLTFLRDPLVDASCAPGVSYVPPRTEHLIKCSVNRFVPTRTKKKESTSIPTRSAGIQQPKPRRPLKDETKRSKLFKALSIDWSLPLRRPLAMESRRFLVEDFIQQEVGSSCVVLVSSNDPFFLLSWLPLLLKTYNAHPTHSYRFGDTLYYSIEMVVVTNSLMEDFDAGTILQVTAAD